MFESETKLNTETHGETQVGGKAVVQSCAQIAAAGVLEQQKRNSIENL
jgi:hypothetical protein